MNNGVRRKVLLCPVCDTGASYFTHGSYAACVECKTAYRYLMSGLSREEGIVAARKRFRAAAFTQTLLKTLPAGTSTNYIYGSDPR